MEIYIKGIHELATHLGVSVTKAQQLKNSGILPYAQHGRIVLFKPDEIFEALKAHSKPAKRQ